MKIQLLLILLLLIIGLSQCIVKSQYVQTDVTQFIQSQMQQQLNFSIITGYVPIDWYLKSEEGSMFYEIQTKQGSTFQQFDTSAPIIFWLQGGPGCSSQIGAWGEVGAIYVGGNEMKQRYYSWNKIAHLVFVDQPVNVGLSYTTNHSFLISDTPTATKHFINFIYNFFQQNPQLKNNNIYLFGESYGGAYIPAFAHGILQNSSLSYIKLKGVGIGDGWVEPAIQTQYYDQYFYSAGIASLYTKGDLIRQENLNKYYMQKGDYYDSSAMFDNMTNNTQFYGNINMDNFQQYNGSLLPANYTYLLQNQTFAKQFGVSDQASTFINCNVPMYYAFYCDISQSRKSDVEYLLDKINVVLYNGQLDIVVNTPGVLNWVDQISWSKIDQWKNQPKTIWRIEENQKLIGSYKNFDKLTFALVYQAGHMVPLDQPESGFEMFNRTINWSW